MRNFKRSMIVTAAIAVALAAVATPTLAVDYYWDQKTDANWWLVSDGGAVTGNWAGAVAGTPRLTVAPGASDSVYLGYTVTGGGAGTLVDLMGKDATVSFLQIHYNKAVTLKSSTGDPTLNVGDLQFRETGSHIIDVKVNAGKMTYNYKGATVLFKKLVNVTNNIDMLGRYTFEAPVTVGGNITLTPSAVDGRILAKDTLTAANISLVGSGSYSGSLISQHGAGSGGAACNIAVNKDGILQFDVQQTTFPNSITTAAYSALRGDFTGATYGTNVILAENTILGITTGPLPADPDTGVKDARYWLLAASPTLGTVYEASNDADSIYKGIAFSDDLMAGGNAACTFQTKAGSSENLQVLSTIAGRARTSDMTWLADTGVADVYCTVPLIGNGGGINENYAGGRTKVTTFNFHNLNPHNDNNLGSNRDDALYSHGTGAKILLGQTYVIDTGRADVSVGTGILGKLLIKDQSAVSITADLAAGSTGTIEVEQGGAIIISTPSRLENFGGTITTPAATTLCFNQSGNITLNAATQPDLFALIAKSDIGTQFHLDGTISFLGDGLKLANGKFLMADGYQNKTTIIGATSILGAADGATRIGLAAGNGQYMRIDAALSLSDVDLDINSTTLEVVSADNKRDAATGRVRLNSAITAKSISHNAGTMEIMGGTVSTPSLTLHGSDLVVSGGTITAPSFVIQTGTATFSGGTVSAPSIEAQAGNVTISGSPVLPTVNYASTTGGSLTISAGPALDDVQPLTINANSGNQISFTGTGVLNVTRGEMDLRSTSVSVASAMTNANAMNVNLAAVTGSTGNRILMLKNLNLNDKMNQSSSNVEIYGTYSGSGFHNGILTVMSGAKLAPGNNGVGTLNSGGGTLNMDNGSTYEWQVADPNGAAGTGYDQAKGSTIAFLGSCTLKITAADLATAIASDMLFDIAVATGSITGYGGVTFAYDDQSKWTGSSPSLSYDSGTKKLTLSGLVYSIGPVVVSGDTNEDGVVDAADYIAVKQNLGLTTGATLGQGNVDGDDDVDWDDLQMVMTNFGAGASTTPATTPEPATLGLLAIGALAVLRRNRRS